MGNKKHSVRLGVISSGYAGTERRGSENRRQRLDQRSGIRFDDKGGDRRVASGRRENDEGLHFIE
jgi:hypothetical protein